MILELNKQEAEALMALLDIAVKAGGLRVAHNALALAQKIEAAAQPKPALAAIPDSNVEQVSLDEYLPANRGGSNRPAGS